MNVLSKISAVAALAAVSLLSGNVGGAQASDDTCAGCYGSAHPNATEILVNNGQCLIRFNYGAYSGRCRLQEPVPGAPCIPANPCSFDMTALCSGACSNWVQGLWALNGASMPVFIPCGTTLPLGNAACDTTNVVTSVAYDTQTGATAFGGANLVCSKCIN